MSRDDKQIADVAVALLQAQLAERDKAIERLREKVERLEQHIGFAAGRLAGASEHRRFALLDYDAFPGLRTTVLNHDGLMRLFQAVAGRRFVGAVDRLDCVESVFDLPAGEDGNLGIFTR